MANADALLLQVSADIRGLQKQMDKAQGIVSTSSRRMVKTIDAANENFGQKLGRGFGSAIGNNIRNFANQAGFATDALGGLGPAGIAAAAGIAAVGAAFAGAVKAAKFADDIADTANRLSVTTDALQEYRFAIHALGGEYEDADKALEGFTEKFGAAQAQLTKKASKPFEALGLDATKFKTTEAALAAVTDKISKLSSAAEQAAIAEKLGLTALLPALRAGTAEIDKARAAAHRLGFVMDADIVRKGGEAADKLEDLSQVLKVQVNSALVDLTPVILDIASGFADVARAVSEVGKFLDALNKWAPSSALLKFSSGANNMGASLGASLGTDKFGQTGIGQSISRFLGGGAKAPSVSMAELQAAMNAPGPARTGRLTGGAALAGSSGRSGGGRATSGSKEPIFDLPASIRAYEDWLDYKAAEDKRYNDQKALDFMAGVQKAFDLSDVNNDLVVKISEDFTHAAQDFHDNVADAVAGGLDAGIRGGLPGLLAYLTQRFQRTLVDSLASSFADAFASSGSNGIGARIVSSLVGVPRYAEGTDFHPGGPAMVGERGREIVNLPRGSQVIPNDILRGMTRAGGSTSQSTTHAPVFNLTINGDASRFNPRMTGKQLAVAYQRQVAGAKRVGY